MKLVILEAAEGDLKELRGYLTSNFSLAVWLASYNKLKQSMRHLVTFPYSGAIASELEAIQLNQYRRIISGMSCIIYEVRGDTLYVHVIADTRRDLKSLLLRRLLRSGT